MLVELGLVEQRYRAVLEVLNDGATVTDVQWVVEAYALFLSALLLLGGALGDRFGRRRVYAQGVILFAVASVFCGLARDVRLLVLARAAQGIGAALLVPGSLAIISASFSERERGRAIGTWSGFSAITAAVGPVLGGLLTEHVSWRAIFYLNIPVAIGAVLATLFAVRESRDTSVGREVDYAGVAVLTVGLTALVLALVEGNAWGWGSAGVLGLLAASLAGLVAFVVIERRSLAPIVDFRFFRSRSFLGANLVAFTVSFSMFAMFFFLALYMQNILGYGPLDAGLRFLPSTLVIIVMGPIAGRLADRVGPKPLMVAGLLTVSLSLLLQSQLDLHTTFSDLLVINKTDLAPMVGADLDVMRRDAAAVRADRRFAMISLTADPAATPVLEWVREQLRVTQAV